MFIVWQEVIDSCKQFQVLLHYYYYFDHSLSEATGIIFRLLNIVLGAYREYFIEQITGNCLLGNILSYVNMPPTLLLFFFLEETRWWYEHGDTNKNYQIIYNYRKQVFTFSIFIENIIYLFLVVFWVIICVVVCFFFSLFFQARLSAFFPFISCESVYFSASWFISVFSLIFTVPNYLDSGE